METMCQREAELLGLLGFLNEYVEHGDNTSTFPVWLYEKENFLILKALYCNTTA